MGLAEESKLGFPVWKRRIGRPTYPDADEHTSFIFMSRRARWTFGQDYAERLGFTSDFGLFAESTRNTGRFPHEVKTGWQKYNLKTKVWEDFDEKKSAAACALERAERVQAKRRAEAILEANAKEWDVLMGYHDLLQLHIEFELQSNELHREWDEELLRREGLQHQQWRREAEELEGVVDVDFAVKFTCRPPERTRDDVDLSACDDKPPMRDTPPFVLDGLRLSELPAEHYTEAIEASPPKSHSMLKRERKSSRSKKTTLERLRY